MSTHPGTYKCPWSRGIVKNPRRGSVLPSTVCLGNRAYLDVPFLDAGFGIANALDALSKKHLNFDQGLDALKL